MSYADPPPPRYLIDENVARRVTLTLRGMGREAIESRDVVGPQAADRVLEYVAAAEGLTLVSHDRDFKVIVANVPAKRLIKAAPLLWLNVSEVFAADRLAQCLGIVEDHIRYAHDQGMTLEYVQLQPEKLIARYHSVSLGITINATQNALITCTDGKSRARVLILGRPNSYIYVEG